MSIAPDGPDGREQSECVIVCTHIYIYIYVHLNIYILYILKSCHGHRFAYGCIKSSRTTFII